MSTLANTFLDFAVPDARRMMSTVEHRVASDSPVHIGVRNLMDTGDLSVPVFSLDNLVGVLHRSDVLRYEVHSGRRLVPESDRVWFGAALEPFDGPMYPSSLNGSATIGQIMSAATTVRPDRSSQDIADLLIDRPSRIVYVVDNGVLIGRITTADMLRQLRPASPGEMG